MQINNNLKINGNKVISYTTHVATIEGKQLLVHGWWSATTSRHINLVAKQLGLTKVEQKKEEEAGPDLITFAGMFSVLSGFESKTVSESNEADKRIFSAVGCSFPDDWDTLPEEEKRKRLDGVKKIALENR